MVQKEGGVVKILHTLLRTITYPSTPLIEGPGCTPDIQLHSLGSHPQWNVDLRCSEGSVESSEGSYLIAWSYLWGNPFVSSNADLMTLGWMETKGCAFFSTYCNLFKVVDQCLRSHTHVHSSVLCVRMMWIIFQCYRKRQRVEFHDSTMSKITEPFW